MMGADAFVNEVARAGGRVENVWDDGARFALAATHGIRHVFAWGPGLGAEHHVHVPFALRSPVILALAAGHAQWSAGPDEALGHWLRGHPVAAPLAGRVSWSATLAPGAPPLHLDWTVQARPVGSGGHLVLRAGDYGGVSGLAALLEIIQALGSALPISQEAPTPFLAEPAFAAQAARALGIAMAASSQPPTASFVPPGGSMSSAQAGALVSVVTQQAPPRSEYSKRVNQGGKLFLGGDYAGFIALWESIARDFASDREIYAQALHQTGTGHFALKDYARAIAHYEQALAAGYDAREIATDIADAKKKMR